YASCLNPETHAQLALILLFVSRAGAGIAGATISTAQAVIADSTTPEERRGGMALIGAALSNDLQLAALRLRPTLSRTLETGNDAGALGALVSGSGPTCVFLARDDEHSIELAVALSSSGTCNQVFRATGPAAGAHAL
ncbi:MAG: hypothetical protein EBR07_13555, partial [Planctomycetes bacterium]|nr:hypothetical protein [Planctomycetota bacterium]